MLRQNLVEVFAREIALIKLSHDDEELSGQFYQHFKGSFSSNFLEPNKSANLQTASTINILLGIIQIIRDTLGGEG